jgi:hypothetical protein
MFAGGKERLLEVPSRTMELICMAEAHRVISGDLEVGTSSDKLKSQPHLSRYNNHI